MEWSLDIPKILHLYWGGEKMPYLRFMTIKTFIKHNPDWEINLYYPKHPALKQSWFTYENKNDLLLCKDFTPELEKLPINKIEVDFEDYGVSNTISEVHKSDFIRLIKLNEIGGLWSDMDIFYIKPMNDFYLNKKFYKDIETFVCIREYGHSIGFMMATKGNKFFKKLGELSMQQYEPVWYQTLGARLYNKYFKTINEVNQLTPAINIQMDVVYPHVAGNENELIDGTKPKFTDRTIGVHWYAGHPQWKNFLLETNGGLINLPDCIIGNLLKNEN